MGTGQPRGSELRRWGHMMGGAGVTPRVVLFCFLVGYIEAGGHCGIPFTGGGIFRGVFTVAFS